MANLHLEPKVENIKKQGKMFPVCMHYHQSAVNMIRFNKDGTIFASCGNDKKVNVFNAITNQRLGSLEAEESLKAFEMSKDCEYVITGGFVGSLEIWRMTDGKRLGKITFDLKISCLELSYGDEYLMLAGDRFSDYTISTIHIFRFKDLITLVLNNEPVEEKNSLYTKDYTNVVFTRMRFGLLNDRIYIGTESGWVKIVSIDLETVHFETRLSNYEITSINFSKRHEFLICTMNEGYKLMDPETLEIINSFKTNFRMNCAQISPLMSTKMGSKPHIIMGGGVQARDTAMAKEGGLDIFLVNIVNSKTLSELRGHFGPVNWLEWFKDGSGFVSAGSEGIIRVYRFDQMYFEEDRFN